MYESIKFPEPPSAVAACELLARMKGAGTAASPRRVDRPLAIYGAGDLGRMAREYLDRLGIKLEFVVDANAEKARDDAYWSGIPIVSPGDVSPEIKKGVMLAVSVVTAPYVSLAEPLATAGWEDIVPFYDIAEFYRDIHPLSNGWFANPFTEEDLGNISTVLQNWDDDISRAHHLQFLAWRFLREEWVFDGAAVSNENRFFIPEVMSSLGGDDSFADVGAHAGSVTLKFIDRTKGRFQKIWAIEPDPENLARLEAIISGLSTEDSDRIEIIPATLGGAAGEEKFFRGLGYASQRSDLGKHSHQIETIDNLRISPSFMKLHLEGSELDALKGAAETIAGSRPIIAATSYHNHLGIWELPMWLMDKLEQYRFYMRAHSWCGTGSVVYAIPNNQSQTS